MNSTFTSLANVIIFLAVFQTLNAVLLYLFPRPEPAAQVGGRRGAPR